MFIQQSKIKVKRMEDPSQVIIGNDTLMRWRKPHVSIKRKGKKKKKREKKDSLGRWPEK